MQLTSWLLVSFCNIKLLFWRYWCRHMTKLFWLRTQYLSELLHFLVAKLACGPTIVWSKPRASSGFTYRAGGCQAHRPQGWSVNGKDDYTIMASARSSRQQWQRALDSLSIILNYLQLFCSRSLHDTGLMFESQQRAPPLIWVTNFEV